jgi:rfaE bifunctional protein nucleotidyltransferase chain/domain
MAISEPAGDLPPAGRTARDKVKSLSELSAILDDARRAGHTVAHCHGVFDLVHMGHVRHLEQARKFGSILVVTITADKHVSKGPNRPVFTAELRAEMLAALEYVDWVAVNDAPNAVPAIEAVKPDSYIKGSDYKHPDDDVTGMIELERETVERFGGRLQFTDDIVFSSSSLINEHLDVLDPEVKEYLADLRGRYGLNQILTLLERASDYKVVMVGDTIIDEYQYVEPLGKSPKENMISTNFQGRELFAGGVVAAANHVASFCREVEIVTALGGHDSYEKLVRESLRPNVKLTPIYREGAPTTRKSRFVESSYMRKLFEVYFFDDQPLDTRHAQELNDLIASRNAEADVTVVTDFGHGLIGSRTIDTLSETSKFLAINAQSNSGNHGYNLITKYPRADYLVIDAPEARLAVRDKYADLHYVAEMELPEAIACERLILTHGRNGCVAYRKGGEVINIPAFTKTVVDTVGAGDAFFSVTAPMVAAGGDIELAGVIGNAAGALKVGIVGHRRSVDKVSLIKYITTLLK